MPVESAVAPTTLSAPPISTPSAPAAAPSAPPPIAPPIAPAPVANAPANDAVPNELTGVDTSTLRRMDRQERQVLEAFELAHQDVKKATAPAPAPPAVPGSATATLPPAPPPVAPIAPIAQPQSVPADPYQGVRAEAARLIASPNPEDQAAGYRTLDALRGTAQPASQPTPQTPPVDPGPQVPDWAAERTALSAHMASEYKAKNTIYVQELDANGNITYTPTWKPGTNPEENSFIQDHLDMKTELAFRDKQAAFQASVAQHQQAQAEKQAQAQRDAANEAAQRENINAVSSRVTSAFSEGNTLDFPDGSKVQLLDMVPTDASGKPTQAAIEAIQNEIFRLNREVRDGVSDMAKGLRAEFARAGISLSEVIPIGSPAYNTIANRYLGLALGTYYSNHGGRFIAQAKAASRTPAAPAAPPAPIAVPPAAPPAPAAGFPPDLATASAPPAPAAPPAPGSGEAISEADLAAMDPIQRRLWGGASQAVRSRSSVNGRVLV